MTGFGEHLKQAREAKGVTLDSVSRATRIAPRYLDALERGELGALPGRVFEKGFIKAYAEYLDLDPEPVLAAHAEAVNQEGRPAPENDRRMLEEMHELLDRRRGRKSRFSSGVKRLSLYAAPALVLATGIAWLSFGRVAPVPESAPDERVTLQRPQIAPPPPAETKTVEQRDGIRITQSGVGTALVERDLAGRGTRFVEGTKLWYWTRVLGGAEGERIVHVWIHDGRTSMRAELSLGGPHWRTHSTLTLPAGASGEWAIEARAADGRVLARDEFVCVPRGSDVHEDLEAAVEHSLHVERHRFWIDARHSRILHDLGVHAIAMRPRLVHDPGEDDGLAPFQLELCRKRRGALGTEVVPYALPVLQGSVLPPDFSRQARDAPVGGKVLLPNGQNEAIDVRHDSSARVIHRSVDERAVVALAGPL
jgi:transcriptional regulator with XRE-family HTH domain